MVDSADVWMPRKTFEFGATFLDNPRVRDLTATLLEEAARDPQYGRRSDLEGFWAREHAAFLLAATEGRAYADYLPGRLFTYLRVADVIEGYVAPPANIIELGSGSGLGLALLGSKGFRCTAFDIAVTAVNYSRVIAEHFGTSLDDVYVADYYDPPAELYGMFDLVFNVGALEHHETPRQQRLIRTMARCSRQWIVVFVPNTESPIYQTMEAAEFEIMPAHMVYPEEHETHSVNWESLFEDSEAVVVKSGAIHIAPPVHFRDGVLNEESRAFFDSVTRAVRALSGPMYERWLTVERNTTEGETARWGWFKYAVFRKRRAID